MIADSKPLPEAKALPTGRRRRRKYYAVARGHQVGVFHTDEQARAAYERYSGAKHQAFTNEHDAEQYIQRWKVPTDTPSPTTSKTDHIACKHYPAGHAGLCDIAGSLSKKFMCSLSKKQFDNPVQPSATLSLLKQQAGLILAMNEIEEELARLDQ